MLADDSQSNLLPARVKSEFLETSTEEKALKIVKKIQELGLKADLNDIAAIINEHRTVMKQKS